MRVFFCSLLNIIELGNLKHILILRLYIKTVNWFIGQVNVVTWFLGRVMTVPVTVTWFLGRVKTVTWFLGRVNTVTWFLYIYNLVIPPLGHFCYYKGMGGGGITRLYI